MIFTLRVPVGAGPEPHYPDSVLSHHDSLEAAMYALCAYQHTCKVQGTLSQAYVWHEQQALRLTYDSLPEQPFASGACAKACQVQSHVSDP